jgi:glutamyl-tRNA synthetase
MSARTRYAPSPTGTPHVGNIRTALFDWLYARKTGGQFILRIEDTDRARLVEGALDGIYESMRWLGLDWDEGPDIGGPHAPYVQSERLDLYQRFALELIEGGHAYECYCSPERLQQVREAQQARKQPPRYDRHCRDLSESGRAARRAEGVTPVVRLRVPDGGKTSFDDAVRGHVEVENATLDDFVMLKSDGYPTAQLAHVVDDHLMQITHVMRGEDWVPSTPRQMLIYQALGWDPPQFVHLSQIVGPDKSKLSKRHGAVSALDYREQGFLPEAMVNFLGLLGWSLDDHTVIISREDLIANFALERLIKHPAVFDLDKLAWLNGVYIREHVSAARLAELVTERLEAELPPSVPRPIDRETVTQVLPLIRERMQRLEEAAPMVEGFFTDDLSYGPEELLGKKFRDEPVRARAGLASARERLASKAWTHEDLEATMRTLADDLSVKPGDLFMLLRVAVTGRVVSPPLFESMEVIGRERCMVRIDHALGLLETPAAGPRG